MGAGKSAEYMHQTEIPVGASYFDTKAYSQYLKKMKVQIEERNELLDVIAKTSVNINPHEILNKIVDYCLPDYTPVTFAQWKINNGILLECARLNEVEIARALLKSGHVDVNTIDVLTMRTPLMIVASHWPNTELVEILLSYGADLKATDVNGLTALMIAASNGRAKIVEMLLNHNSGINDTGFGDKTALHCASYNGDEKIVEILLQNKADFNIKDWTGRTPLKIAKEKGFDSIRKLLVTYGATE